VFCEILRPGEKVAREVAARLLHGDTAYSRAAACVDMVRGLTPKDYDIVTDARPEAVQRLFPQTVAVGAHFGVIIVLENGFQFEVATFRSDDRIHRRRHPSSVHFPRLKKTRSVAISPSWNVL